MKIRYRIIPQEDRTYSVEVSEARGVPYTVPGFKSEAEAQIWAAERAGKSMDKWERQPDPDKNY